jgi:hypothetical protein
MRILTPHFGIASNVHEAIPLRSMCANIPTAQDYCMFLPFWTSEAFRTHSLNNQRPSVYFPKHIIKGSITW